MFVCLSLSLPFSLCDNAGETLRCTPPSTGLKLLVHAALEATLETVSKISVVQAGNRVFGGGGHACAQGCAHNLLGQSTYDD